MFPYALRYGLVVALFAVLASLAVGRSGLATEPCYLDWSQAAAVVDREGLVTVETLGRQFRERQRGEIVNTQLCRINSRYVYRLVVRMPKGKLERRLFDAREGAELNLAGRPSSSP